MSPSTRSWPPPGSIRSDRAGRDAAGSPLESTIARARPERSLRTALCALLLALAAGAAYSNGLDGPFVFDDGPAIAENPRIRSLSWRTFATPRETPVAGRPVVQLSLALNYALGGLDPRGYHLLNLAVHLLCGLALFGLVRRTLVARDEPAADGIALAAAALWLVHPLTSECIAYTTQRTESLMALFFLSTLYGVARTATAASALGRRVSAAGAVLACALGMASKEVMVTAPLVALLYDAAYHAGSVAGAWRRRRGLYAGLASTWVVALLLHAGGSRVESVGTSLGVSAGTYLVNQAGMLAAYLKRVVWPHPLVIDYGWPRADPLPELLPAVLLAVAVVSAVGVLAWRRPAIGFPLVAGLIVLAPSSSVVPIVTEVGAERRMYLPLAGLAVLAAAGGHALISRLGLGEARRRALAVGCALAAVALLTGVTRARNRDYRSAESLWLTAVAAVPDNPRARVNLGEALRARGRLDEAEGLFRGALALRPGYARAEAMLGRVALDRGDVDAAIDHYRRALALDPRHGDVRTNLGELLARSGRTQEALAEWREAFERNPELALAANDLAWVLATHPDPALRNGSEAVVYAERSAELTSFADPVVLDTLAAAYAESGRWEEAVAAAQRALALAAEEGDAQGVARIRLRLAGYEARRPHREPPPDAPPPPLRSHEGTPPGV